MNSKKLLFAPGRISATLGSVLLLLLWSQLLTLKAAASEAQNPLFSYPHLLASPFTLPAGRFIYGTDLAYGVTDSFQIGTSLLRDLYQVYNASAKLSVFHTFQAAFALTVGYETFNYKDLAASNPDLKVSSWTPGAVVSLAIFEDLALFTGGNLYLNESRLVLRDTTTSGYVQGAKAEVDLSWEYSPPAREAYQRASKKGRKMGNVLSTGVSYDFTYKLLGVGLSHYFQGLHLGVHYYPKADQGRIQPILLGGGSIDL